jgi:prepilin-type N-terminal cleavage/methylation domain-containing protein
VALVRPSLLYIHAKHSVGDNAVVRHNAIPLVKLLTAWLAQALGRPRAADGLGMRSSISAGTYSSRSRGFTLIEAVVAASLAGIVAAFAVPSFTRVGNEARASEVMALGTHLQNAAQTAHARFLESGSHLAVTTIEGRIVNLKNGYPGAGAQGIRNAVPDSEGFAANEGDDFVAFTRVDAPSRGQCSVTYRMAENDGGATVTNIDTRGC